MSGGRKNDSEKPQMDLLDTTALVELAKVLDFGAKKYDRFNWKAGIKWSRVISAAMRHITAFNNGEDVDPETGISHMAHAMCNCMFLLNYIKEHPELDDRYKPYETTTKAKPGVGYTTITYSSHNGPFPPSNWAGDSLADELVRKTVPRALNGKRPTVQYERIDSGAQEAAPREQAQAVQESNVPDGTGF